jgi:hypothetical protein
MRGINLVEEPQGNLYGFEMKWQAGRDTAPKKWADAYPAATFQVIHPDNYLKFIK